MCMKTIYVYTCTLHLYIYVDRSAHAAAYKTMDAVMSGADVIDSFLYVYEEYICIYVYHTFPYLCRQSSACCCSQDHGSGHVRCRYTVRVNMCIYEYVYTYVYTLYTYVYVYVYIHVRIFIFICRCMFIAVMSGADGIYLFVYVYL